MPDALNGDRRCAFAFDLRAHRAQTARQIDNFRFPCGVFQNGRAFGQSCRHQDIFCRPNRHDRKFKRAPLQTVRGFGMHIAIFQVKFGAQCLKTFKMQINGPCPNCTSPRQRHNRMTVARQHWPQNEDRGTHFSYDVIVGFVVTDILTAKHLNLATLKTRGFDPK